MEDEDSSFIKFGRNMSRERVVRAENPTGGWQLWGWVRGGALAVNKVI